MAPSPPAAARRLGLGSISDENLLQQLAGDNLELRKQLQALLGRDSFEKADPAPVAPKPRVVSTTTKH